MGGGDQRDQTDANVIIPETGAAKYWYVDPRATGVPGPGAVMPTAQTRVNPADPFGIDTGKKELSGQDINFIEAVNRLIKPGRQPAQEQDDRPPMWFTREIGGERLTPEELNKRWLSRMRDQKDMQRAVLPEASQMYFNPEDIRL